MSEFIAKFLAPILEKFKLASPAAYAIIAAILLTMFYFAKQATLFGVFALPTWAADAVQFLSMVAGILFSSQTFQYLPADEQAKRQKITSGTTRAEG